MLAPGALFREAGDAREEFVRVALATVAERDSALAGFECAYHTLANVLRGVDGGELRALRLRIARAVRAEYPRHYRPFLLLFTPRFADFEFADGEPGTVRSAKLDCLAWYLL